MTMTEKQMISIQKEIEKLTKSLNRYQGILDKKVAKCEKLNCNWIDEEWFQNRDTCTPDQSMAHFEMTVAQSNVDDTNRRLENATKRLNKFTGKFEEESKKSAEDQKELDRAKEIESSWLSVPKKSAEELEAEYQAWLKQFKAECLKDGVVIENATDNFINGTTKSGKKFVMYINCGMTERSWHCYTLRIDGQTIFTSGDFSTGYAIIKK
jgi:hypothetical protein